ncbi:hypothetical protein BGZ74_003252 [Mortierella antarctica]|nr:hypothetical protein BGZ74_003252 [Mortierella antarctica]
MVRARGRRHYQLVVQKPRVETSTELLEIALAAHAITIAPFVLPLIKPVYPTYHIYGERSALHALVHAHLSICYHENALNKRHKRQPVPDETYTAGHHARDGDLHVVNKGGLIMDGTEDGTENGTKLRLHELTVGPGIFHVLVFAANILQQTEVSIVKEIDTASSKDLADNVYKHLQRRSKWAYKSLSKFSATESAPLVGSNKVFIIHVIASDLTVPKNASPVASAADGGNEGIDQGAMYQKYGVAKHGAGALIVVRPNGHLGYRVKTAGNAAWEDVDGYFRSILSA